MTTHTDKEPVSFEKTYEFTCLVELLEEKYPSLTSGKIYDAIERCIAKTQPPRERNHFIRLLKEELGVG